jgi:hypothetical protein
MKSSENKPLSASRIKTLQTCSWQYWCKYHLKMPDTSNHGSLRGTICHAIFENLGNPRHKHHYQKMVKAQDINVSPPIKRMVTAYAKKYKINDLENLDLINRMTIEGLNYDFFGDKNGKPTESISEKNFDIKVSEGDKNFRILGFIDKLFLFKRKKEAIIRDFKTSKRIISGKDYTDNMQHLMYCLAVKYLYPEYLKRTMEFLFVKFDCNTEGSVIMNSLDTDELEGFEYFLTEIQGVINNFTEKTGKSSLAYDKGYPAKEDGFAGKIVCGRAEYKGQLKKDGTLMWHCPFKFPQTYYAAVDEEGNRVLSAFSTKELKKDLEAKGFNLLKIEKVKYDGCPAFSFDKDDDLL